MIPNCPAYLFAFTSNVLLWVGNICLCEYFAAIRKGMGSAKIMTLLIQNMLSNSYPHKCTNNIKIISKLWFARKADRKRDEKQDGKIWSVLQNVCKMVTRCMGGKKPIDILYDITIRERQFAIDSSSVPHQM